MHTNLQSESELVAYLGILVDGPLDEAERLTVLGVVRQARVLIEVGRSDSDVATLCAEKLSAVGTQRMTKISEWYAEKARELETASGSRGAL